jgi:hypothetical protein
LWTLWMALRAMPAWAIVGGLKLESSTMSFRGDGEEEEALGGGRGEGVRSADAGCDEAWSWCGRVHRT